MNTSPIDRLREGTVIPAVPLVLDEKRRFDQKGQRRLIRYYCASGAGGIAAAVHTTQFAIRSPEHNLLEPVLMTVASEVKSWGKQGTSPILIAGVCGPADQAVLEAEVARDLGYDAVLVSTGGLTSLSEDELIERSRAIADILPIIGFYLQPLVGGRALSYDYWSRLCDINNLVAIKCAAFDRYKTLDVARAVAFARREPGQEIALYTGNDDNILADLLTTYEFQDESGNTRKVSFAGGLLGHWAFWTSKAAALLARAKRARQSSVIPIDTMTLAAQITDSNAAAFDAANGFKGCIAGVHEILRRQGLLNGVWCLDPNETMSPGQAEEIDRIYWMYPHLNDDAFVRDFIGNES
jgi:dihydrodipicolinate synthase/N-acetylneuraminate lyase